jgi:hypothetical protein
MMLSESGRRAISNLGSGLRKGARIPQRVLSEDYKEMYVTDFRRIFSPDVVNLLKVLMQVEGGSTVAVACFQQSKVATPERQGQGLDWRDDVFFVSDETDEHAYSSFIRRNWSEYGDLKATLEMRPPWLVFAEIVGACSDTGGWYLYCDRFAEVALLGFREKPGVFLENRLIADFSIQRLADALAKSAFLGYTENEGSKRLRDMLRSAYLT